MIRIFEMFAGYGTATFALKRLGIEHKVVGFSEIDKFAIKCFLQNHGDVKNFGDCRLINPDDIPDFNLLTAGFPCQAFSSAGKRLGELDSRGTLFNDIIRIAEVKRPKYMLLENVKGLTTKKFEGTFNKILSELDRIGYNVTWEILNTKDYGIPQSRSRVFFVCIRKDIKQKFEFPAKQELKIKFKDCLDDLPFREIPPFQFGKYCDKDRLENLKSVNDDFFHTLTINRTHANQYFLNKNKTLCRNFIKIESFRLQGFKDKEINLDGFSDNQAHKLAGNGQSVNVVEKIFRKLLLEEKR